MTPSEAKKRVIKKHPQAQIAPWVIGNGSWVEVIKSPASMRTLGVGATENEAWLSAANKLKGK